MHKTVYVYVKLEYLLLVGLVIALISNTEFKDSILTSLKK